MTAIFCVNWFRTDEHGKFVWPGFGENMRVLKWMLERIEGRIEGREHVFGVSPEYHHLTWSGLDFSEAQYRRITAIEPEQWRREFQLHAELFGKLRDRLPKALADTKTALEARLATSH